VLGKFLGALGLLGVLLLLLTYVPVVLYVYGDPDSGIMWTSLLGVVLLISCYVAVGIAASSLSENMIVAAILGVVTLLFVWVIEIGTLVIQTGWMKEALEAMSLVRHVENFSKGVIDTRDVIYLVSFAVLFLFIGQQRIESLRWK